MQMQPNDLAESQKAEHCVSLRGLLNASHLIAVEASGTGYLPNAPLASCFAHRCADLLGGHALAISSSMDQIHMLLGVLPLACATGFICAYSAMIAASASSRVLVT